MLNIESAETRDAFLSRCGAFYDGQTAQAVETQEQASNATTAPPESQEQPQQLFEQVATEKPRVDEDAGIIYHAHLQGPVSKHGHTYALPAMQEAGPLFEQMSVGLDHAYDGKPMKVAEAWGTVRNPVVDDQGIWGDVHYLKAHESSAGIIEDIKRGTRIFALSAVNDYLPRDVAGKQINRYRPRRLDVVVGGATTRSIMEQTPSPLDPQIVTLFEQLNAKLASLESQINEAVARVTVQEQALPTAAALDQVIAATVKGVDLSQFKNFVEV